MTRPAANDALQTLFPADGVLARLRAPDRLRDRLISTPVANRFSIRDEPP